MRLFDCLVCKSDEESPRRHIQGHVAGRLDADPGRSGQPSPKQQTLNDIQAALLRLEGSWPRRVEGLISLLKEHGLVAKVYGFVKLCGADEWVVLLPDITNGARAGWPDDAERDRLLRQLSSIQAPGAQLLCASQPVFNSQQAPQQHPSRETAAGAAAAPPASTSSPTAETTSAAAAAAAVPLIRSDLLVGALWLQTDTPPIPPPPPPPPPPDPGPYQPRHLHATIGRRPSRGGDAVALRAAPPAVSALSLLRSSDCLRQLSFAASMCLAAAGGGCGGSDCLPWLSEAVAALRSAPSMQALTAHLCGALSAHVRSRFVLEAETRVAIVPPPTEAAAASSGMGAHSATVMAAETSAASTATALLLRSVPGARQVAGGGGGLAAPSVLAAGGVTESQAALDSEGVNALHPSGGSGSLKERRKLSSSLTREGMGILPRAAMFSRPSHPADDGTGSSYYGNVWNHSAGYAAAATGAAGVTAAAGGSALRSSLSATDNHPPLSDAVLGSGLGTGTGTGTGLGLGRSLGRSAGHTAIVALSPEDAAVMAYTSPHAASTVLHADAFPLRGSLLHSVITAHQQGEAQTRTNQRHLRPPAVPPVALPSSPPPLSISPASLAAAAALDGASSRHAPHLGGGGGARRGSSLAMLSARGPPAAAAAAVIEDTRLYLQRVSQPSRDVCLLMDQRGGAGSGLLGPGPVAGSRGEDALVYSALTGHRHSSSTLTSSVNPQQQQQQQDSAVAVAWRPLVPQSLVLLTLSLREGAAMGLYLCFPKRLPGPLLEAVRASCQELVDKILAFPVRDQLAGALAPEYDTLIHAAPGSYAVVRGLSAPDGGDDDLTSGDDVTVAVAVAGASSSAGVAGGGTLYDAPGSPELGEAATPPPSGWNPFDETRRRLSSILRATSGRRRPHSLTTPALLQTSAREASMTTSTAAPAAAFASGGSGVDAAAAASAAGYTPPSRARSLLDSPRRFTTRDFSVATAEGGGGGSGSGYPTAEVTTLLAESTNTAASLIRVAGVEAVGAEQARRRMDLLVSSIQATIQASAAAGTRACAFGGDLDQLELVEVLGRGGGGVVLKGLLSGSMQVAVKLVGLQEEDAERLDEHGMRVRRGMLRNAMELAVQSSLSHPNIVQFYGTFSNVALRSRDATAGGAQDLDPSTLYLQVLEDEAGTAGEEYSKVTVILAEFCDGGSLAEALAEGLFPGRTPPPLPIAAAAGAASAAAVDARHRGGAGPTAGFSFDMKGVYMTLLDVALALRHLHSLNLVHRDIKPANLLLKSNPRDHRGFTVKLADFGFVLQLTEIADNGSCYAEVESPCGTLTHIAPECLQKHARVDTSADIYSFGILMWEMLAGGVRPFSNVALERIPRLVRAGARPPFTENVPQGYRSLAHQCWRTDPRRRPRAPDLVTAIGALLASITK